MDSENSTIAIEAAAKLLGMSRDHLARGIRSGEFPVGQKVGDRYIIPRAAVEHFLTTGQFASPGIPLTREEVAQIAREGAREALRGLKGFLEQALEESEERQVGRTYRVVDGRRR